MAGAAPEMNLFDIGWTLKALAVHIMTVGERREYGVRYNPLSARAIRNPYPVYRRMREAGRVYVSRALHNNMLLTHHADVSAFARQDRLLSHDSSMLGAADSRTSNPNEKNLFNMDPPAHTRLRKLVTKAFTPRTIRGLEPEIRLMAHELVDAIDDPRGFDFVRAFALQLPIRTIAIMLGVPREDYEKFAAWTLARARLVEPLIDSGERRAAERAAHELADYFRPVIRDRRAEPRADIVTALAQAEEDGDRLSEQEMLNMLRVLLATGSETTVGLLGSGLLALMRHPDQEEEMRGNFDLVPGAVEEMLRYDVPVQLTIRFPFEDCEIDGLAVKARRPVLLMLGAANRDPAAFPDPERFDIHREMNAGVMSFGGGIHYCLGAALARMEARIAFETLYERFGAFRLLTDRPGYRRGITLRHLRSLPVRAVPARSSGRKAPR